MNKQTNPDAFLAEHGAIETFSPASPPAEPPARKKARGTTKAGRQSSSSGDDNRPLIRIAAGQVDRIVDEAEEALNTAGLDIYQRGSFIVRPGTVNVTISDGSTRTAQRILELGDYALLEAMGVAARWEKFDGRAEDWVTADPPMRIAKTFKDRVGRWRLPVLAGIVNAPTLRADGSILGTSGYDAATGLILDAADLKFPGVPTLPTKADAEQALKLLKGLIETFPFVGDADRAVALSALLTAPVRRAFPTAPLHGFSAPTAGSGKSMLVDATSMIVSGREAGVIAQGKSEEEMEKRLGALLLEGAEVIAIDNCEAALGGEFLCQMLTQTVVRARILGRSEAPELPSNAFITATGNNLTFIGDMTRRGLLCRLDPKCERPELRKFTQNPLATIRGDRGKYVAAVLTVLRAYHVAGRPKQADPLGSFERWSRWVRDALLWLGEADPVATMEEARALDPKLDALNAVVAQWREVIGPERVTVRGIIEWATRTTTDTWGRSTFCHPDFREALLMVAGAGGAVNSGKLGQWLGAHHDRVISGCRIVRGGVIGGTMTWRLHAGQGASADAS